MPLSFNLLAHVQRLPAGILPPFRGTLIFIKPFKYLGVETQASLDQYVPFCP
jgi:hypothetical protein